MTSYTDLNKNKYKPAKHKHKLAVVILIICIVSTYIYACFTWSSAYQLANEAKIRQAIANRINRKIDPNNLTDHDFEKVVELNLSGKTLSDIKYIRKCINLQKLNLNIIKYPQIAIPKWVTLLANFGFCAPEDWMLIDLQPLKNLSKLQYLSLMGSPVKNTKPLEHLINLEELDLSHTKVSDIKYLKGLRNLKELDLYGTSVSHLHPISGLTNLTNLRLGDTMVTDLKQIKNLTNLESLHIGGLKNRNLEQIKNFHKLQTLSLTEIYLSDIEVLKELKSLTVVNLVHPVILGVDIPDNPTNRLRLQQSNSFYLTKEDFDELRKALPNVTIQVINY